MPYWSIREAASAGAAHPLAREDEAEEALDELLLDAVRLCMVADVPLGVFLSGGIDSSSVVAAMQAQSNRPVRSFTIGFREDRYDEAAQAKAVARHLGTDHTELYVGDAEARAVIPLLPDLYDEPFADSSQIPTCLISKLARQSVTVSLSGDGGDELFGGYNRYVWGAKIARGIGAAPRALRSVISCALEAIPVGAWDMAAGVLPARAWLPQTGDKVHKLAQIAGSASREAAYLQLTSLWQNPDSVVRGGHEPLTALANPARWPEMDGFIEKMMLLDSEAYLPGDILTKVDRASMAVSLETRVPLLDHRLVEFAWRLPLSMRLRNGQGKWLLRKVLDRYVPRALIDRPKMGFGVPIDSWLRGPLRDWAETLLAEARLHDEGFFDPAPIRKRWAEHLSGRRNWQNAIWTVLMFQAWLERQKGR
jgi:asparagine synthase (glutamine-hydrolysing)